MFYSVPDCGTTRRDGVFYPDSEMTSLLHLPPTFPESSSIANGIALSRDLLAFFRRLAQEAGDFAHYSLNDRIVYFVNDPALVREILLTNEGKFRKWAFNGSFGAVFGQGLIASEGELHRRMRQIAQPSLRQQRMPDYAAVVTRLVAEQNACWHDGELEVSREFTVLTLDIIGQVLFSVSLRDRADIIIDASRTLIRLSTKVGSAPDYDERFYGALGAVDEVVADVLRERAHDGDADSLLAHLWQAHARDQSGVSERQVIDEMRTFVLAGHITTANTLACACWLLARHPAQQTEIHAEVDAVLGGRTAECDDAPQLARTEMVLLEALRLHPPVATLGREAIEPVELGGYSLPAGSNIVISPWLLHRNPALFPDPEAFQPARWANNARAALPRGAYLPFSVGSRSCLGERFAMLEATLILSSVLQNWEFAELPDAPDPGWAAQLLYWPSRGIRLDARRRSAIHHRCA